MPVTKSKYFQTHGGPGGGIINSLLNKGAIGEKRGPKIDKFISWCLLVHDAGIPGRPGCDAGTMF
jgi:hypothetical protein